MIGLKKAEKGAAFALALILSGCSSAGSNNSNYWNLFQLLKQSWAASTGHVRVSYEQVAAVPYASLGYRLDGGNQMMLVLATDTDGDLLWTSPSRVVLVTRNGRIVRSLGLGHDLAALTTSDRSASPAPIAALKAPFTSSRLEDFPDIGLYGVLITCQARQVGRKGIMILGKRIATMRVDEACRSANLDWSFVDSFWLDADSGLVWQSRQHIHPKGGVIELETLRPPG